MKYIWVLTVSRITRYLLFTRERFLLVTSTSIKKPITTTTVEVRLSVQCWSYYYGVMLWKVTIWALHNQWNNKGNDRSSLEKYQFYTHTQGLQEETVNNCHVGCVIIAVTYCMTNSTQTGGNKGKENIDNFTGNRVSHGEAVWGREILIHIFLLLMSSILLDKAARDQRIK